MTQSLIYVMTGAVVVSAIAIVIQMGILLGLYRRFKTVAEQLVKIAPKAESLVESTRITVDQSRKEIQEITSRAVEMMDSTKAQLVKVDEILTDATVRAKVQMDRIEMVLDDTVNRVQETVALMHNGVMRPLREASGVIAGVKAAVSHLARGSRTSPERATSDEEMFI
jgi:hypothetical protein